MSKILKNRLCGRLSILLAIMMILPIVGMASYGAEKSTKAVVISNVPDHYKLSVGKGEGITVGTKGEIVRDGKEIAKFEVTSVDWGYSEIKVSGLAKEDMIRVGDDANVGAPNQSGEKIKKSDNGAKALLAILLVGAVVALSGHHGGGGGGTQTALKIIAVTSKDTGIPADGKSATTITATVNGANNTAAPDGTKVQFATSAGSITPSQTTTTAGKATAVLTAGSVVGPATVTVTVGGKSSTVNLTFTSGVVANLGTITLTASPTSIQVIGSGGAQTQSTLTATCKDAQGNLVNSGMVTFTSTLGSVVASAAINGTGVATTTFSSNAIGQAQITATWSGASANAPVTVTAGPPFAVIALATPSSIEADGNSFAVVKASVTDVAGNPVTDGTVVSFSNIADVNGGGNGFITPIGYTIGGVATATLYSRVSATNLTPSNPGTATVSTKVLVAAQPAGIPVPAVDLEAHETQVQFISYDVSEIVIARATPWSVVSGFNQISLAATVYDANHHPVPDGTAVYFATDKGMIYGSTGTAGLVTVCLTSHGQATANFVNTGDYAGDPTITVTSGNKSALPFDLTYP